MTLKQAMKRIEALEQKVRELEARPPIVINNPAPIVWPTIPAYPYEPLYSPFRHYEITCASGSALVGGFPQN